MTPHTMSDVSSASKQKSVKKVAKDRVITGEHCISHGIPVREKLPLSVLSKFSFLLKGPEPMHP